VPISTYSDQRHHQSTLMRWFAVQLSEQECFQVPLESKETLAGTKFLWQFVPQGVVQWPCLHR
jgi:hypothetical protein